MSRTEMRSKGAIQEMLAHCLIQAGKIRVGRGPGSMKRYEERSRLVLMAAVLQWVLGETITEESIAKQHAALDELEKHALAEIERNLNANRG